MTAVWIMLGIAVCSVILLTLIYDRKRGTPEAGPGASRINRLLLAGEAMFALVLIGVSLI